MIFPYMSHNYYSSQACINTVTAEREGCMSLKEEIVVLRLSDKPQVWMGAYVCTRVCVCVWVASSEVCR